MKKLSIIVPIYNVENYLEKCIDSIINQTYKNLEIILVDDGSTDSSGKIADEYAKKDDRIKIVHKENGGVSSARNVGIKEATGKYICFIDADDYVDKEFIGNLMKYQNGKYDIIIGNAYDFDEKGIKKTPNRIQNAIEMNRNNTLKEFLNGNLFTAVCWGNLYRCEIVKSISFDEKMRIAEDGKFLLDAINMSNINLLISDRLYYYYIRNDSVIHSGFSDKYYDEMKFCKDIIRIYGEKKELNEYANKKYFLFLLRLLAFEELSTKDYNSIIEEFKDINAKNINFKDKLKYFILKNKVLRNILFHFKRLINHKDY